MRPTLSATGTSNYALAKWLDEKLKPLSVNNHTNSDVFQFAEEIHELDFNDFNITQDDLVELLRVATKHQLFQFNGSLYEQIDGVAMGSPLGPLTHLCVRSRRN